MRPILTRFRQSARPFVMSYLPLIALIALLTAGAAVMTSTLSAERVARTQVTRTVAILDHLRGSLLAGLDAETGQRGFLLTRDASYLTPYQRGRVAWLEEIDALEALLPPHQQIDAQRLRDLAQAKLAEMAATIAYVQAGQDQDAMDLVQSDEGKHLMDAYRILAGEMQQNEEALLANALEKAARREDRALLLMFLIGVAVLALVLVGLLLARRTAIAETAAREADALRQAHERSDLLARELDHRVKNLFAVVLSIISRSGMEETDVRAVLAKLRDRVHALSVAHSVSSGELEHRTASLTDLVTAAVTPYRDDSSTIVIAGPDVQLHVDLITPIGLILHELATNAGKYGALRDNHAKLEICWTPPRDEVITLTWRESGVAGLDIVPDPDKQGFGSMMMMASARQIGGRIDRTMTLDGLDVTLDFRTKMI